MRTVSALFIIMVVQVSFAKAEFLNAVVLDARTSKPVTGAAVVVFWGQLPPGGGKPNVDIHELETDAQGRFAIERSSQPGRRARRGL